jgi:hypothetical protein
VDRPCPLLFCNLVLERISIERQGRREELNAKEAKEEDAEGAKKNLFAPFAIYLCVLCV